MLATMESPHAARQEAHVQALNQAITQVLEIRQYVEQLPEATRDPQHTRKLLQDVGSKVDALTTLWPTQIQPALQQADTASTTANAQGIQESGAAGQKPGTGEQGPTNAGLLQQVVDQLDAELAKTLAEPINNWEHLSKRHKAGALPPPKPASDGGTALQEVVALVSAACPAMQIHLASSTGALNVQPKDALEVRLQYTHVLTASVALAAPGQPRALRVALDSADKLTEGVAWRTSQHHVFKRISALAGRALNYFFNRATVLTHLDSSKATTTNHPGASSGNGVAKMEIDGLELIDLTDNPTPPPASGTPAPVGQHAVETGSHVAARDRMALEDLLIWLAAYRDLFTRPCAATGQLLMLEPATQVPLPPVFRPFKLSRDQLLEVARDDGAIRAYHTHAAPPEMLGLD